MKNDNEDSKNILKRLHEKTHDINQLSFNIFNLSKNMFYENIRSYNSLSLAIEILDKYKKDIDQCIDDIDILKSMLIGISSDYKKLIQIKISEEEKGSM